MDKLEYLTFYFNLDFRIGFLFIAFILENCWTDKKHKNHQVQSIAFIEYYIEYSIFCAFVYSTNTILYSAVYFILNYNSKWFFQLVYKLFIHCIMYKSYIFYSIFCSYFHSKREFLVIVTQFFKAMFIDLKCIGNKYNKIN